MPAGRAMCLIAGPESPTGDRVSLEADDLLSRLVLQARQDLQRRRHLSGLDQLERAAAAYEPRDFAAALRTPGLAVIAEMKQRTPSMGVLSEDYRPADLAHAYAEGGAAAISVLTHMAGFGGRPEHVKSVRAATGLPILRKDFITDPYEVAEARASGADAVLLIAAALDPAQLGLLLATARSRGIAALVEVHDESEAATAMSSGAEIIGVNHRDLRTFAVDLSLTERLRRIIPASVTVVAESGIHSAADARRMRDAGADAILVGEELMRAPDPAARIRELTAA
jgi:indole-3-glycerol phosphate synthase